MSDTNHMIMMTSFITISLRMLKNSIMSLAFSPILPMQMPKAIKKPIRPETENHDGVKLEVLQEKKVHENTLHFFREMYYSYLGWI